MTKLKPELASALAVLKLIEKGAETKASKTVVLVVEGEEFAVDAAILQDIVSAGWAVKSPFGWTLTHSGRETIDLLGD
jgi:hypothetical protein